MSRNRTKPFSNNKFSFGWTFSVIICWDALYCLSSSSRSPACSSVQFVREKILQICETYLFKWHAVQLYVIITIIVYHGCFALGEQKLSYIPIVHVLFLCQAYWTAVHRALQIFRIRFSICINPNIYQQTIDFYEFNCNNKSHLLQCNKTMRAQGRQKTTRRRINNVIKFNSWMAQG